MPETPVKCHHTRWQSSHPPSVTRLISQRLRCGISGAVVRDALASTAPTNKLIDNLVQLKDPHNGATC